MTTRTAPLRARILRPIRSGWRLACQWLFAEGPYEPDRERRRRAFVDGLNEMFAAAEMRSAEVCSEAEDDTRKNLEALRRVIVTGIVRDGAHDSRA